MPIWHFPGFRSVRRFIRFVLTARQVSSLFERKNLPLQIQIPYANTHIYNHMIFPELGTCRVFLQDDHFLRRKGRRQLEPKNRKRPALDFSIRRSMLPLYNADCLAGKSSFIQFFFSFILYVQFCAVWLISQAVESFHAVNCRDK